MRRPGAACSSGGFELDDDPARIDVDAVHAYISGESYWGRGRPRELTEAAIAGSRRVVGLYRERRAGRLRARRLRRRHRGLPADVYVLPAWRGRGLGVELVREMVDGREGGLRSRVRWMLHTADAAGPVRAARLQRRRAGYPLMERARGYDSAP